MGGVCGGVGSVDDLEVMMMTKAKRRQRAQRYEYSDRKIGYRCGDSWLRVDAKGRTVRVYAGGNLYALHGHCDMHLTAGQCRTLAAWLIRQARQMEKGA